MELVITLGGDVVLGTREKWQDSPQGLPAYLEQYGLDYPFANLIELFEDDDMTLVNLECVLKDDASNMTKNKQYIFRGATSYAQALVDASIEQVNLANNHVIDYQSAGEVSTGKPWRRWVWHTAAMGTCTCGTTTATKSALADAGRRPLSRTPASYSGTLSS